MRAGDIEKLREMLREKFPESASPRFESKTRTLGHWPTGIEKIDEQLHGGFPKGALTEMVFERRGGGSASIIRRLIERATEENHLVTLIDGADSLDLAEVNAAILERLLWVRCHSAAEAIKAADLALRDGNLGFVLVDVVLNPPAELRKIPATVWYRFQRILEKTSTVCVVFTPAAMIAAAERVEWGKETTNKHQ